MCSLFQSIPGKGSLSYHLHDLYSTSLHLDYHKITSEQVSPTKPHIEGRQNGVSELNEHGISCVHFHSYNNKSDKLSNGSIIGHSSIIFRFCTLQIKVINKYKIYNKYTVYCIKLLPYCSVPHPWYNEQPTKKAYCTFFYYYYQRIHVKKLLNSCNNTCTYGTSIKTSNRNPSNI